MSFSYDGRNIPLPGGCIPPGKYLLRIIDTEEKLSGKGYNQVVVGFKVMEGPYAGREIKFHLVTFIPKGSDGRPQAGAGFAIHFLKCIGQPWEDDFEVNHLRWRGCRVKADVIEDTYNGKTNNKIAWVEAVTDKEEIPF